MTKHKPVKKSKSTLKAVFLDRDGVLNNVRELDWVKKWEEFVWLDGAKEAVSLIRMKGFACAIISNQSCIGRGIISRDVVDVINKRMVVELEKAGGRISGVYVCPHRPDEGCDCRKPRIANLKKAMADLDVGPDEVLFIGDYDSDRQAAANAGCHFQMVTMEKSLLDIVKSL